MSALAMAFPMEIDEQSFESVLLTCSIPPSEAAKFRDVRLPFNLRPHQLRGLHCGLAWDRFGLYHEARTGKTIVMQLLAIYFSRYGMKTVFLMPPVLFTQFTNEFNRIENHGLSIELLDGSASVKRKKLQSWALGETPAPDVLLTTKEIFAGPFGTAKKNLVLLNHDYISRVYKCLTWDECHIGLQDESSQIFKAVERFTNSSPHNRLVLATGTPITSELKAAYSHIRLKTPDAYVSRRHFDNNHVVYESINIKSERSASCPDGMRRISVISGYVNTEMLSKNLYAKSDRARKLDVLDIKVPNVQVVDIRLSSEHLKFYQQAVRDRLVEIEGELIDLRQEQTLRQFALRIITSPEWGGKPVKKNSVLEGVQSLLDTANVKENKVLIFANFNNSVTYLRDKLEKYNPAVVYGKQSGEYNRSEVTRFKTEKACRVIIVNPQAGGVGLTLGDVCQTAIFAEPVASPGWFEQAASRILLDGQTQPVSIYILKILQTASPAAIESMLSRTAEISKVMKDKKTLIDELLPKP